VLMVRHASMVSTRISVLVWQATLTLSVVQVGTFRLHALRALIVKHASVFMACLKCAVINNCESSPCLNGASCTNGVDTFSCSCVDGYTDQQCQTG
jgi:hypothetical protein